MRASVHAVTLSLALFLLVGAPTRAQDGPPVPENWYAAAVAAGEIDDAAYRARVSEILADVNAARGNAAGVGDLEWDSEGSEGHFRHAGWLLQHMREPWNSGGVTDFHDEVPGSELYSQEGRSAARDSVIAFKYIKRDKTFLPTERWLPTVAHRLPWLMRSAARARVGYAEGVIPDGAEFAGWRWGVVVMELDRWFWKTTTRPDSADDEPVICPRDGAENMPVQLVREVPDIVPSDLDKDHKGKKRKLGFPVTFSFFGGESVLGEVEATLVRLDEVPVEDEDKPRRKPPGRGKKKKKKPKKKKPKTKTVEVAIECHVSTPLGNPLREKMTFNYNSVVLLPVDPLDPGATYRATLKARIDDRKAEPRDVQLVTTFKTAPPEK